MEFIHRLSRTRAESMDEQTLRGPIVVLLMTSYYHEAEAADQLRAALLQ